MLCNVTKHVQQLTTTAIYICREKGWAVSANTNWNKGAVQEEGEGHHHLKESLEAAVYIWVAMEKKGGKATGSKTDGLFCTGSIPIACNF